MKQLYTSLIFCLFIAGFGYGQTLHSFQPSDTDPAITSPNSKHTAYPPNAAAQQKLVVFFPGTYGWPALYSKFQEHASNQGFHVLGLSYPNSRTVNGMCSALPDTSCHLNARMEILDGTDRHTEIDISPANCIYNRLSKALAYLSDQFPDENWDQFFVDGEVQWNSIITSGHSQGAGHAALLGKLHQVDRVIQFAGMDWIAALNRNANWVYWNGATSPENFFGFNHLEDELVGFDNQQTSWKNLGMGEIGSEVNVDENDAPFGNSQQLYTTAMASGTGATKNHGSPVIDKHTPTLGNGDPAYASVWSYLLGVSPTAISEVSIPKEPLTIFPNPVTDFQFYIKNLKQKISYKIIDTNGATISEGETEYAISLPNSCKAGIYFLVTQDHPITPFVIK